MAIAKINGSNDGLPIRSSGRVVHTAARPKPRIGPNAYMLIIIPVEKNAHIKNSAETF